MSIEKALKRLQAGARGPDQTQQPAPVARVGDRLTAPNEHDYHGRSIRLDVAALRDCGLVAQPSDMAHLAEEFRLIKRSILKAADASHQLPVPLSNRNLAMIASALPGEGKTFTSVNLCLSIAQDRDWSIVLVDGDCGKAQLTHVLGADGEPGLIDLLDTPALTFDSVVMPTDIPGLSFLPAGRPNPRSSELLASRRMQVLCSQIAGEDPQRVLIFDSAPLLLASYAPVLTAHVGQIVLVVRANSTPRQAVISALEKVDHSKHISCILNQQTGSRTVHGYYGYGAYGEERGHSGVAPPSD